MPPSPLLVMLSLLLATRLVPRATACRSITWSRNYPGPTSPWQTTARPHANHPTPAQQLELIEHMLGDERRWGRVLRRGVKLTARNRPPYHADDDAAAKDPEVRALLRLVDANAKHVTPLPVLQRVTQLRWLGSYVEYATYVTRSAFTCLTYGIARTAFYLVWRMWQMAELKADAAKKAAADEKAKGATADAVATSSAVAMSAVAAVKAKTTKDRDHKTAVEAAEFGLPAAAIQELQALLAVMAAKLVAVHGDLTTEVDALFELAMTGLLYPSVEYDTIDDAHGRFEEYIKKRCAPISDEDSLLDASTVINGYIRSSNNTLSALAYAYRRLIAGAMQTYDAFDLEAVPLDSWASVVDYNHPVVNNEPYLQPHYKTDPFDVKTNTRLREKLKRENERASGQT